MSTQFRTYQNDVLLGGDYRRLRDFLIGLDSHNYHFGRWDWMITHSMLDPIGLPKIGLWEEGGAIVAAATYDCVLGKAYLLADPQHRHLAGEMLAYARDALVKDGAFSVLILDGDTALQDTAARSGFVPTQEKECDAVFPIAANSIRYALPEGFSVVSLQERPDAFEFGRVLWKGFNHEAKGEGAFDPSDVELSALKAELFRDNVDLSLKIAAIAPDGHFASFCGMWQDARSQSALVEPVATDPAYRRMGLGRAVVLEAIRRCGERGAKRAFVGSSQQFYYSIGFRPYATSTWWSMKNKERH